MWILFQKKTFLSLEQLLNLQEVPESTPHGTTELCVSGCSTSVEDEVRFTNS